MKKYLIDTIHTGDFTAGSKARSDIDDILTAKEYQKVSIHVGMNKKDILVEVPCIKHQINSILQTLEPNSLLVVQYPWETLSYSFAKMIAGQTAKKNVKTVLVIHDLNSIRTGSMITKAYYEFYVKERKYIDSFNRVICHNNAMKKSLVQMGLDENKIIPLEIFDYLLEKQKKMSIVQGEGKITVINVAGNLSREKAAYLYQLAEDENLTYSVNLYGPNYEGPKNDKIKYRGTLPASELPQHLSEGFGLVWDGESVNTCSGHFGDYLRINNPHKLSLYMASGIPVIVWKHAAIAEFVKKYQVGYSVDSLHEINNIMNGMTKEKYQALCNNVNLVREKVSSGFYTRKAIAQAEKSLGCV